MSKKNNTKELTIVIDTELEANVRFVLSRTRGCIKIKDDDEQQGNNPK